MVSLILISPWVQISIGVFFRFFLLREMVHCAELGKPVSLLSGGFVVMRSNAMRVEDSSKSKSPSVIDGIGSCDLH